MSENSPGSHFFTGEIAGNCVLQKLLRVRERCEIWRAFDRKRECPAVLKFLHRDHRRAEIFPDLADFLMHSGSPGVVRLLDFFPLGDYFAAESEYVSGGSLRSRLGKQGRFSLAQAVYILRDLLLALKAVHGHGIIHRDIKPGNILLTSDGALKLGDFGIARLKSHPEKGPQIFGTPTAMSPEQTVDATKADERSDFFSLSSTIYEVLTGRPRFPRGEFVAVLKSVRASQPRRLREDLAEYATGDLISLLERMAANDPADRPENAGSILAELDRMRLPCQKLTQAETAAEETQTPR